MFDMLFVLRSCDAKLLRKDLDADCADCLAAHNVIRIVPKSSLAYEGENQQHTHCCGVVESSICCRRSMATLNFGVGRSSKVGADEK